jgi:hypothetical protein
MDHYREADINRYVLIGATAVMAIGVGLWGLRGLAQQGLKRDALEAPWVVTARAEVGSWKGVERTLTAPAPSEDVQTLIARWQRENGVEAPAR